MLRPSSLQDWPASPDRFCVHRTGERGSPIHSAAATSARGCCARVRTLVGMYDELHAICDRHGTLPATRGASPSATPTRTSPAPCGAKSSTESVTGATSSATTGSRSSATRAASRTRHGRAADRQDRTLVCSHTTAVVAARSARRGSFRSTSVHVTRHRPSRRAQRGRRRAAPGAAAARQTSWSSDSIQRHVSDPYGARPDHASLDVEHCLPVFDHLLHAGANVQGAAPQRARRR